MSENQFQCGNCGNCGNCYKCVLFSDRNSKYMETMKRSIFSRLLYCNCFMCTFSQSASCLEITYYLNCKGDYEYYPEFLLSTIENDRKKAKKRIIILFLQCMGRFLRILSRSNEKRYMPNGKGFLEAKLSFDLCKEKI